VLVVVLVVVPAVDLAAGTGIATEIAIGAVVEAALVAGVGVQEAASQGIGPAEEAGAIGPEARPIGIAIAGSAVRPGRWP
jgi:hypothetical protein